MLRYPSRRRIVGASSCSPGPILFEPKDKRDDGCKPEQGMQLQERMD